MREYGHLMRANPLRKFPRNLPCGCGSGVKFKKCCYPNVALLVPEKLAQMVIAQWENLLTGASTWSAKKETQSGT